MIRRREPDNDDSVPSPPRCVFAGDQRRLTAVRASFSTAVGSVEGVTTMMMTTFDLNAKIMVPPVPELVKVYSTALSPIPVTTLAVPEVLVPFRAAASFSGEIEAAAVTLG